MRFSDISDQSLDKLVSQFVNAFPCAGQKTLAGYLQSQTYHIQRWRIRESMLRVDPWGWNKECVEFYTAGNTKLRVQIVCGILMVITNLQDGESLYMEQSMAILAFLYIC